MPAARANSIERAQYDRLVNFIGHLDAVVQKLDALEVKIMQPDAAQSTTEDWSAVYSQLERERGAFELGGTPPPPGISPV